MRDGFTVVSRVRCTRSTARGTCGSALVPTVAARCVRESQAILAAHQKWVARLRTPRTSHSRVTSFPIHVAVLAHCVRSRLAWLTVRVPAVLAHCVRSRLAWLTVRVPAVLAHCVRSRLAWLTVRVPAVLAHSVRSEPRIAPNRASPNRASSDRGSPIGSRFPSDRGSHDRGLHFVQASQFAATQRASPHVG